MAYQTQFRRLDVLIEPMRLRAVLLPELLVQVKVWFRGRRGFKDVRGIEAVLGNPRHRIAIIAGVPEGRIGLLEGMHPPVSQNAPPPSAQSPGRPPVPGAHGSNGPACRFRGAGAAGCRRAGDRPAVPDAGAASVAPPRSRTLSGMGPG